MKDLQRNPLTTRSILGLVGFVALCQAIGGIGAVATGTSVSTWYQTLSKPSFNPPDWVFGPVWTTLYLMMAIAAWRVWNRFGFRGAPAALAVFGFQLALNLLWSFLFFGFRRIDWALIEIVLLLLAIVVTIALFQRKDTLAAVLLVPYVVWVSFATVLCFALWRLN